MQDGSQCSNIELFSLGLMRLSTGVTLVQNKFGPNDLTAVGTEFHSLEAFRKNEL